MCKVAQLCRWQRKRTLIVPSGFRGSAMSKLCRNRRCGCEGGKLSITLRIIRSPCDGGARVRTAPAPGCVNVVPQGHLNMKWPGGGASTALHEGHRTQTAGICVGGACTPGDGPWCRASEWLAPAPIVRGILLQGDQHGGNSLG